MGLKQTARTVLLRGGKIFAISFISAGTTGVAVMQQQMLSAGGTLNLKPVMAAASTAFLVAFASSVLHLLERSLEGSSESVVSSPAPLKP